MKQILVDVYKKTESFAVQAGKIIFVISIVLWFLASHSPKSEDFMATKVQEIHGQDSEAPEQIKKSVELEYSYLGYVGKTIEPTVRPLGYDWKISIALVSSFAAREVFVGTLSTIYSIGSEEEVTIVNRLQNEYDPITNEKRFNLPTALSLLIFYVFAMQCMSTLAIVKKETYVWRYAIYQLFFFSLLAYVAAFLTYELFSYLGY